MRTERLYSPERLYTANQALIGLCLRRFPLLTEGDREDAYSAAMLALWKAALGFDPERGYTFATFATDCIRHALLNHLKTQRQTQKAQYRLSCVSLDAPIGEEGEDDLADMIADGSAALPEQGLLTEAGFDAWLVHLRPRQQEVLRAVYQDELTPAEIGEAWGISHQTVYRLHRAALHVLRNNVLRNGILKKSRGNQKQGQRNVFAEA